MTVKDGIRQHDYIKGMLEQGYRLRDYFIANPMCSEETSEDANINVQVSNLLSQLIIYVEKYEAVYKKAVYEAEIKLEN